METKTKNIKNTTRKEWRKAKQRAARAKKKEAVKLASEKRAAEPKRYDLLAQYNPVLKDAVREIIKDNKIKYSILTDAYFVIANLSEGACKEIETAFAECKQSRGENKKPNVVRFARWKSKTIIHEEPKEKKPSNNTEEAKQAAKARRKAANVYRFTHRVRHQDRESKPITGEDPIPTHVRNAKKLLYRYARHKFKATYKVCPALKETSLEKKRRQRAVKACKYLVKQETKQNNQQKKYTKQAKASQQKIDFAA